MYYRIKYFNDVDTSTMINMINAYNNPNIKKILKIKKNKKKTNHKKRIRCKNE